MTDLQKTILQKASGETRLNPDEQRHYMGTFRERVVLVVSFQEATQTAFQTKFNNVITKLSHQYTPLTLKLSASLSDSLQIQYMKEAKEAGWAASIVDEKLAESPYALVCHTDQAIDKETITLEENFPELLNNPTPAKSEKKGFLQKLFGG